MSFLQGSLDLFTGIRTAHMGSYQYVSHAGTRDGKSMSGAELWAGIEFSELNSTDTNLFSGEELLLQKIANEIQRYIPNGSPVLELGPGTSHAFTKKTLPLINTLQSDRYICVDESLAFLRGLSSCNALSGIDTQLIEDDFLDAGHCYQDDEDAEALVCMFGSTIGNTIAPLSNAPPKHELIESLKKLAAATHKGWLLISLDTEQDGEKNKSFYTKQSLFQLNVFYRMAVELPLDKNFDPKAFDYEADWNPHSGQLAHLAIVNRDLQFAFGGKKIALTKNQRLHMKNSFKFFPVFFENCCELAGLTITKVWMNSSSERVYLLKKLPQIQVQRQKVA